MKYISHLDLLRLFQRAARRAGLAVEMSKGFSPRMRLSIEPALKLGLESDGLMAKFRLTHPVNPQEFKAQLQAELPSGVELLEVMLQ